MTVRIPKLALVAFAIFLLADGGESLLDQDSDGVLLALFAWATVIAGLSLLVAVAVEIRSQRQDRRLGERSGPNDPPRASRQRP